MCATANYLTLQMKGGERTLVATQKPYHSLNESPVPAARKAKHTVQIVRTQLHTTLYISKSGKYYSLKESTKILPPLHPLPLYTPL